MSPTTSSEVFWSSLNSATTACRFSFSFLWGFSVGIQIVVHVYREIDHIRAVQEIQLSLEQFSLIVNLSRVKALVSLHLEWEKNSPLYWTGIPGAGRLNVCPKIVLVSGSGPIEPSWNSWMSRMMSRISGR